ncbi:hypothetical protein [Methylocystis echinoides]|uniref:hypothetical protein n=1 Tax=Methylocystis echinoides TaxID=29468 RepID=UPI003440553C
MTDAPTIRLPRFQLAESQRSQFFATVEEHIKPEDVLEPGFWMHVVSQLRPYDEIIVATDSCEWRALLLVADVWHKGARMVELSRHNMASADEEADNNAAADLKARWRGPVNKWCVVRSDGVILKAGLPDRNSALANLAALAAERARVGY